MITRMSFAVRAVKIRFNLVVRPAPKNPESTKKGIRLSFFVHHLTFICGFSAFNPLHWDGVLPILCDNLSLIAETVCDLARRLPRHGSQF